MRTPRRIAIVLCWAAVAAAAYLRFATAAPAIVSLLVFFAGFLPYVLWLRFEPYFERSRMNIMTDDTAAGADAEDARCVRCGRTIVVDPDLSRNVFEGMHWLCFHLEFEHDGDPDLPCSDTGCPQWVRQVYEAKLRELGADPAKVLGDAVATRCE